MIGWTYRLQEHLERLQKHLPMERVTFCDRAKSEELTDETLVTISFKVKILEGTSSKIVTCTFHCGHIADFRLLILNNIHYYELDRFVEYLKC